MKRFTSFLLASLLFGASFFQSGCFGQFELTKKVWEWNDDISDSKFVKTLFFWVLNIIPVYGIASFVDVLILNVIEFWSGSNPMSMTEGEKELQLVSYKGNDYRITAVKNKMTVEQLTGKKKGAKVDLVYTPETQIWTVESNEQKLKVAKFIRDEYSKEVSVEFYYPNGDVLTVPYSDEGFALIRQYKPDFSDLASN